MQQYDYEIIWLNICDYWTLNNDLLKIVISEIKFIKVNKSTVFRIWKQNKYAQNFIVSRILFIIEIWNLIFKTDIMHRWISDLIIKLIYSFCYDSGDFS